MSYESLYEDFKAYHSSCDESRPPLPYPLLFLSPDALPLPPAVPPPGIFLLIQAVAYNSPEYATKLFLSPLFPALVAHFGTFTESQEPSLPLSVSIANILSQLPSPPPAPLPSFDSFLPVLRRHLPSILSSSPLLVNLPATELFPLIPDLIQQSPNLVVDALSDVIQHIYQHPSAPAPDFQLIFDVVSAHPAPPPQAVPLLALLTSAYSNPPKSPPLPVHHLQALLSLSIAHPTHSQLPLAAVILIGNHAAAQCPLPPTILILASFLKLAEPAKPNPPSPPLISGMLQSLRNIYISSAVHRDAMLTTPLLDKFPFFLSIPSPSPLFHAMLLLRLLVPAIKTHGKRAEILALLMSLAQTRGYLQHADCHTISRPDGSLHLVEPDEYPADTPRDTRVQTEATRLLAAMAPDDLIPMDVLKALINTHLMDSAHEILQTEGKKVIDRLNKL